MPPKKITPIPNPAVAAIKAKMEAAETKFNGLAQTRERLGQQIDTLTIDIIKAQTEHVAYKDALAIITPPVDAPASGEPHAPVSPAPDS